MVADYYPKNNHSNNISQSSSDRKGWRLFKRPFCNSEPTSPSSTSANNYYYQRTITLDVSDPQCNNISGSVSSVARSLIPTQRRLELDPSNKLFFPYEPGKQVKSAIRIKNISKSFVAFKFQTTAPKSCFMSLPGAVLAPGESVIVTVVKFVEALENNEQQPVQKIKAKFKILSLKIKEAMDYYPELFDEQKEQVAIEQILKAVNLEVDRPDPALDKLNCMLAEAEAAREKRTKPQENKSHKLIDDGPIIDEWRKRRERYLAAQQV